MASEHDREQSLERIATELRELRAILSQGSQLGALGGLAATAVEALGQLSARADLMVCLLEQVTQHTCGTWNELHTQTRLQLEIRDAVTTLSDLMKSADPAAALEVERLRQLAERVSDCCPPEDPEPVCKVVPCIPGADEGEAPLQKGSTCGIHVTGAPYPPIETPGETEGRNIDVFPSVPAGPLRGSLAPVLPAVGVQDITGGAGLGAGADPVVFFTDTPFGSKVSFKGFPPDMSGASGQQVVLTSGNTWAAYSTDAGATFTALDPTTIFPSGPNKDAAGNFLDNGLCCDQVIQYVPSIDRFIWLMQFCGSGPATNPNATCLSGVNRLRIAAASPGDIINSAGTSWTYWDLTSAGLNLGSRAMDYPDLAVGTNSLYVSADSVGSGGLVVVRIPLSEIQAAGVINFEFTDPTTPGGAYGSHLSQNTGDTVYWAGHSSTSQMTVLSMAEGQSRYTWRNVDHDSYPNTDFSSLCPDNNDWLKFIGTVFGAAAVIGSVRVGDELWLAWTAARGGGFAHPHIQVLQINTKTWTKTKQWQIWNADHAFAYPSLALNSDGEVGISLAWGGGLKFYASFAVGILGDFVVWFSEASTATDATNSSGTPTPSNNRWGDFVTCRQANPNAHLFSGTGYAVLQNPPPAAGTQYNTRYILFGRQSQGGQIPGPPH